jgi:hypothetical protein
MPKKSRSANPPARPAELRGVIDQIEGEIAVVVFDDDQRLDWPRRYLPPEAKAGDAVIVRVAEAHESRWSGQSDSSGRITLANAQTLQWPGAIDAAPVALDVAVDAGDTAARKERVRSLVDDIFKKRG